MSMQVSETIPQVEMWPVILNANSEQVESKTAGIVVLPEIAKEFSSRIKTSSDFSTNQNQRMLSTSDVANCAESHHQPSVSTREAVDPDKYMTIVDEMGVPKFKCSKCGNVYKWRKSLNKHWKEKHDKTGCHCPDTANLSYVLDAVPCGLGRFEDRFQTSAEYSEHQDISADNAEYYYPTRWNTTSGKTYFTSDMSQSCPITVLSQFSSKTKDRIYDGLQQSFDNCVQKETSLDVAVDMKHLSSTIGKRCLAEDNECSSEDVVLDLSHKGHVIQIRTSTSPVISAEELPLDLSRKSLSSTTIVAQNGFVEDGVGVIASFERNGFKKWKNGSMCTKTVGHDPVIATRRALSPNGLKCHQLQCFRCCIKFSSMAGLNQHFVLHHLDSLVDLISMPLARRADALLSDTSHVMKNCCTVCRISFLSMQKLAEHFDEEHATIRPNPYRDSALAELQNPMPSRSVQNLVTNNVGFRWSESRLNFAADNNFSWSSAKVQVKKPRPKTFKGMVFPNIEYSKDVTSNFIYQNKWKPYDDPSLNNAFHGAHHLSSTFDERSPGSALDSLKFSGTGKRPYANEVRGGEIDEVSKKRETGATFASALEKSIKNSTGNNKKALLNVENTLPHKCEVCGFRARWPSEMNQHKKNHSDEKPFKCPNCNYRSKWKWDVGKHLKRCGSNSNKAEGGGGKRTEIKGLEGKTQASLPGMDCSSSGKVRKTSSSSLAEHGILSERQSVLPAPEKVEEENDQRAAQDDLNADVNLMSSSSGNAYKCTLLPGTTDFCHNNSGSTDQLIKDLGRHCKIHLAEKPSSSRLFCCSQNYKRNLMNQEKEELGKPSKLNGYNCTTCVPMSNGHSRKFEDRYLNNLRLWRNQTASVESCLEDGMLKRSGHSFGGIVLPGGLLKCCLCDFEAISVRLFHERQCPGNICCSSRHEPDSKDSQNHRTNVILTDKNTEHDIESEKSRNCELKFWKSLGLRRKTEDKNYEIVSGDGNHCTCISQLDHLEKEIDNEPNNIRNSINGCHPNPEAFYEEETEEERESRGMSLTRIRIPIFSIGKDQMIENEESQVIGSAVLNTKETDLMNTKVEPEDICPSTVNYSEQNPFGTGICPEEKVEFWSQHGKAYGRKRLAAKMKLMSSKAPTVRRRDFSGRWKIKRLRLGFCKSILKKQTILNRIHQNSADI